MPVRQTSVTAYNTLMASGSLSRGRKEVYDDVFHNGPTTSGEFFARVAKRSAIPSQKRARFTELRDMGLFIEVGTRACNVTGHSAIAWDVTNRSVPLPRLKQETKSEQLKKATQRIADLESMLVAGAPVCPGCLAQGRSKILASAAIEHLAKGKSLRCTDCGLRMKPAGAK
jgi:hypothetical protein